MLCGLVYDLTFVLTRFRSVFCVNRAFLSALRLFPWVRKVQVFVNINSLLRLLWIKYCIAVHIFSTELSNKAPQFTNLCTDKKLKVLRQQKDLRGKKKIPVWRTHVYWHDVIKYWWRASRAKPDWPPEWKSREFFVNDARGAGIPSARALEKEAT